MGGLQSRKSLRFWTGVAVLASVVWMVILLLLIDMPGWFETLALTDEDDIDIYDRLINCGIAIPLFVVLMGYATRFCLDTIKQFDGKFRHHLSIAFVALSAGLAILGTYFSGLFLFNGGLLYMLAFFLPGLVLLLLACVVRFRSGWRLLGKFMGVIWFVVTVLFCLFVCNLQCSIKIYMKMQYILMEVICWFVLALVIAWLSGRTWLGLCCSVVIAWVIGFANFQLVRWRGDYISPSDMGALKAAIAVADRYRLNITVSAVFWFVFTVLVIVVSYRLRESLPVFHVKRPRLDGALTACGFAAILLSGSFTLPIMYSVDFNQSAKRYGIPLNYVFIASRTHDFHVDGYTLEKAENAVISLSGDAGTSTRSPVIICIQNESWGDLSIYGNYFADPDPFEHLKALSENTQKGMVIAPTVNGPTAKAEYEFLTGMSTGFEGGINPVQYILGRRPTLSMAFVLSGQQESYRTVLFHPYLSAAYDRKTAYKNIGFDDLVFYESWDDKETFRDLVTDAQCYQDMIALYEEHRASSDAPLFLFGITIQNHGGFSQVDMEESDTFFGSVNLNVDDSEIQIYSDLAHETDLALDILIDYFSDCDEDVIICMYGDHQPYLSVPEAFDKIVDPDSGITAGDYRAFERRAVPYFIWANYDIPEYDGFHDGGQTADRDVISLNYLGAQVLDLAGVSLPAFHRYLLALHEKLPCVSNGRIIRADGSIYESTDDDEETTALLDGYLNVYYNYMYDTENRLDALYLPGS